MMRKIDSLTIVRAAPPISLKFASKAADGTLEGLASTFGDPADAYGDVIDPNAFDATLREVKVRGETPLMLWSHDPDRPIGRWTELRASPQGLFVAGQLNLESSGGRDAHAHLKAGDLSGLSIGYRVSPGGSTLRKDGTRLLTALELVEVSVVAIPANRGARVTSVKSFGSKAELEAILRDVLPGRAVKKLMSGGWPALSADEGEPEPPEDLSEMLAAVKAARHDLKSK